MARAKYTPAKIDVHLGPRFCLGLFAATDVILVTCHRPWFLTMPIQKIIEQILSGPEIKAKINRTEH